jgi:hypothetical protein
MRIETVETTVTPTIASSPTRTPQQATQTPQNIQTVVKPTEQIYSNPTPIPGKRVVQRCISISKWNSQTVPMDDYLILDIQPLQNDYYIHNVQALNLTSGESTVIEAAPPIGETSISPNRKRYFAIVEEPHGEDDRLLILDLEG